MKKNTEKYQVPEVKVYVTYRVSCLCASVVDKGATIDDYEDNSYSW